MTQGIREHDLEPIPGLPGLLPRGERILWQGRPRWRPLARHALATRWVVAWFLFCAAWRIAEGVHDGKPLADVLVSAAWLMPVMALGVGVLSLIAWVQARAAMFTITDRRVVIRHGVALEMAVNLPFQKIVNVDLKAHSDGTGDLVLRLAGPDRLAYAHMWPFARPWHLSNVEPSLRVIPEADKVARILGEALAAWHARPAVTPVAEAAPAAARPAAGRPARGIGQPALG